ncbi:hypothetical protein BGZ65_001530 [Modicella reniformis]|uniref:Uncharacterized protein n=1 Tax=Modicella reniformis TaxID=1440133 RepID=A0A9P6SNK4_9FUNG|nr:hypothetical protein BGZ65_001530 [Modicella reniformis]
MFSVVVHPASDENPHPAIEASRSLGGGSRTHAHYSSSDLSSNRGSMKLMTESARAAATSAIVETLTRGETRSSRGESPYIPSSLSMLFSDPEVIQAQEEVERAQLHQQQQQLRQRYVDSQRSFSGGRPGVTLEELEEEEGGYNGYDDDERHEKRRLLLLSDAGNFQRYGYEMVQEEEQQEDEGYHPYATVMSRSDFLAPHEPTSSSPLFPSPLNTLGRFNSISNPLEGKV